MVFFGGTAGIRLLRELGRSRFACTAQATSRVDVGVTLECGGHGVLLPVLHQVPGTHCIASKAEEGMMSDDFIMGTGIRETCFYLVGSGSKALLMGSTLGNMGVQRDSLHG